MTTMRFERVAVLEAVFWAVVAIVITLVSSASHASDLRIVAKSGDFAPDYVPNAHFDFIRSVALDNEGNATVVASLDVNTGGRFRRGIWTEAFADSLTLVAVEGQAVPEAGGNAKYFKFGNVYFSKTGSITYTAQLTNGTSSSGLWHRDAQGIELIAAEGTQAPGFPAGSLLGAFELSNDSPAIAVNDFGDLAILVGTAGVGIGLWTGNAESGLELQAITGQAMAGFPEEDVLENFSSSGIYGTILGMDDQGNVVFHGYTKNRPTSIGSGPNGLWQTGDDGLHLILREGMELPGDESQLVIGIYVDGSSSSSGVLPLIVATRDDSGFSTHVMLLEDGALTPVLASGTPAPGGGAEINSFFGSISVNDSHQTIVRGAFGNTTALWSNFRGGAQELVVQELGPAPDIEGPALFSNDQSSLSRPFDSQIINEIGQIAFEGYLEIGVAGVTSANDGGIWASDRLGNIRLLVREGQQLVLSPGDTRTISQLNLSSFNDRGDLAFIAYFMDGTSAAVVSNLVAVPEPMTSVLALIASIPFLSARRINASRSMR